LAAEILKVNYAKPEPALIQYAAERVRAGAVISLPTDTFYGLAVDPLNLRAVDQVYHIKSRLRHKPLSLIIDSVDQAEELAHKLPKEFYELARRFWPGPLTIIVKAASKLPLKVTANTGNVALRVPECPIPLALVQAFGFPITATSANLSGQPECTTAELVRRQLGERIPLIVDGGRTQHCVHSTIVDLSSADGKWSINREGAIPADKVRESLS